MGAILSMMGLQLASVCLPTEVLVIDERNCLVSLVVSLMLHMSIDAIGRRALRLLGLDFFRSLCGGVKLNVSFVCWLGHNFVLRCDDCNLDGVRLCLHTHCLLHVVMGLLLGVKARNRVCRERVVALRDRGDLLNESDHGLVAARVKLAIVSCL